MDGQGKHIYISMTICYRHSLALLLIVFNTVTGYAQTTLSNVIRPKIQRIVDKLQRDNEVHFGYAVGFSAKPETNNKYYKLYKKLKVKATNDELIELTKSKSEVIVVYTFNILHLRTYDGLKSIFLDHIGDTTWFWTASGCTGFVDRINWFMLRLLKPTNEGNSKSYLTKNEYDLYCDRFKKEDKDFVCY